MVTLTQSTRKYIFYPGHVHANHTDPLHREDGDEEKLARHVTFYHAMLTHAANPLEDELLRMDGKELSNIIKWVSFLLSQVQLIPDNAL